MLLAIDSATQFLSIALHDGRALRAEWSLDAGRQHSARLAPMIQQLMRQAGVNSADLQALAVAVGPGSYTGVRIGVALAKGLAAVADLPLVPLTTLEIVLEAHSPSRYQWPLIATAPAGRSRVIWAKYAPGGDVWVLRRPAEISTWEDLLAACQPPVTISGEITSAGLASDRDGSTMPARKSSCPRPPIACAAPATWPRLPGAACATVKRRVPTRPPTSGPST